jgi:hypothetical protein
LGYSKRAGDGRRFDPCLSDLDAESYVLAPGTSPLLRVPVERDHGFRWKMITQSGGT